MYAGDRVATITISGLSPSTSYGVEIYVYDLNGNELDNGVAAFETDSSSSGGGGGSTSTTYTYDCYDMTAGGWINSSLYERTTTSSSITRPTISGYTYQGYSVGTGWSAPGPSYTGTTCTQHSSSKPIIIFYYSTTPNYTYFYSCYDISTRSYISGYDSNGIGFNTSTLTRPSISGYTYQGLIYHTSFNSCINQYTSKDSGSTNQGYDNTGTTYTQNSNYKYVMFFYSSGWKRGQYYGSHNQTTSFDYVANFSELAYCFFTPTEKGTLTVSSKSNSSYTYCDDMGFSFKSSTFPSIVNKTSNGNSVFTGTYYQYADSGGTNTSGSGSNGGDHRFGFSGAVEANTTYCIVFSNYYYPGRSNSQETIGGTISLTFTPEPKNYYYQINQIIQNSQYSQISNTRYQASTAYSSSSVPSVNKNTFSVTTPTGYNLRGISTSSTLGSSATSTNVSITSTSSSSPTIIYYYYYPNQYTYSFDLNGGSSTTTLNPITGYFNETITIPNVYPTKNDYKFAGWGNNSTTTVSYKPNTAYTITNASNKTLKAVWNRVFYWSNNENINVGSTTPEFINKYVNTARMNVFISLINLYLNTNLSNVTTTTKITTELYNKMATALSLTNISNNKKIMAEDWNNLQTAFNNKKFTT